MIKVLYSDRVLSKGLDGVQSSAWPHTSGPLGVVLIAPYIDAKMSPLLNINHEDDANHWEKS